MELTIERIIRGLEAIKVFLDRSEFVGLEEQTKNQCEILDHAMDALQKYQKIEEIVEEIKQEYIESEVLDKIRAEIEQLPTKTRINWNGCLPDIDYPEIEYVDISKAGLLEIINKYKAESKEQKDDNT